MKMTDEELLDILDLWEVWLNGLAKRQMNGEKEEIDKLLAFWFEEQGKEVPPKDSPISLIFHAFVGGIETYKKFL
ncbi:hypothetical protein P261_01205 [Lachnospiraceae bacterium TWA4]|nr:hypothetical protein P261_01205 [Lachnospiraceae bacterium TWA4]